MSNADTKHYAEPSAAAHMAAIAALLEATVPAPPAAEPSAAAHMAAVAALLEAMVPARRDQRQPPQ